MYIIIGYCKLKRRNLSTKDAWNARTFITMIEYCKLKTQGSKCWMEQRERERQVQYASKTQLKGSVQV